ncbi:NfeD family protein [Reyranella sp.]|uniref:NfeD family protein n=1 Tax=Reyranella sp. TaxID=1929291 RepID=UPI0037838814
MTFKVIFWHWWAIAAVLLVFEMLLPGVVFMFLAIGAIASGLAVLVLSDLPLELQLTIFAIVSVASAVALRRFLRRLAHGKAADRTINARADALVGRTIVLDSPILGGQGRVKLGDGSWAVSGPDMAAGTRVRVTGVRGTELKVEPAP